MTFDKAMIDIVMKIRRRASSDDKYSIKLTNPDLLETLVKVYRSSEDSVLRALTRELMEMVDSPWLERLDSDKTDDGSDSVASSNSITRMYRGSNAQVIEESRSFGQATKAGERVKQKIYRGQVVV